MSILQSTFSFFSKKKVDSVSKAARLSHKKQKKPLFKEVFSVSERFCADIVLVLPPFL
jgi:hypothetical protein